MSDSSATPLRILVTGGAGYVGAVLVPRLLAAGHFVRVLDLYLYGEEALASVRGADNLEEVHGDIRDLELVTESVRDIDVVFHLACISNDPSCDLDPELTQAVNFDCFEPMVAAARDAGVRRFVFASSSSVYGISDDPEVREDHPRRPITDYNRIKGECEDVLRRYSDDGFVTVAIRPATVCGASPRQRLDLTVNILTIHALERGVITVFGGEQERPNIHIQDLVDLYEMLLVAPAATINGRAFNAGYENHKVAELAGMVRAIVARERPDRGEIAIETTRSDDVRSYRISSQLIREELGFVPRRTIEDAICELVIAHREGSFPGALDDSRYYNVKRMQELGLS